MTNPTPSNKLPDSSVDELREQILDILRWPYNKAPVRLTQSEALRRQRADEIINLISEHYIPKDDSNSGRKS